MYTRAIALACAIALEGMRSYANSEHTKLSLASIQRDAHNFETYIDTGMWLHKVVRENASNAS